MTEDRYFIFNHAAAFRSGRLEGLSLVDDGASLEVAEGCQSGVFVTPVLDSREAHRLWQRCLSVCDIPDDGRIVWSFFAVDDSWQAQELERLIADDTVSVSEILRVLSPFEALSIANARDFLLQDIRARYVVCVLELLRRGTRSPRMSQLQIFSAWEGLFDYLPAIYRDEGGFLDRYLRIFFSQYLDTERQIEELPALLDPRVAPPQTLYWLASIISIPHSELWEPEALRTLLMNRTYQRKGTLLGLVELLETFTGYRPYVVERFRMRDAKGRVDPQYADAALHILLPPEAAGNLPPVEALHRVIQSYLPQALTYQIHLLREGARVGDYSYLGISALLTGQQTAVVGANAQLDYTEMGA
jgi:phage tail-like protein